MTTLEDDHNHEIMHYTSALAALAVEQKKEMLAAIGKLEEAWKKTCEKCEKKRGKT